MSLSARIAFFFSVSLFLLITSVSATFAQSNHYNNFQLAEQSSNDFQIKLVGVGATFICQLSGIDIFHPGYTCLGQKIDELQKGTAQQLGVIGMLTGGITSLYQQPVTTHESVKYFAQNFGIVKSTYAQDAGGFQSFSFIQNMFITMRNVSYMLLVILFILIGIAIMLRFKIDPRTVMSIQNQLPKVIIGIILITFSYSIAGLLADGMWLLTYFGVNTVGNIAQLECGTGGNGETFAGVATKNLLNDPVQYTSNAFSEAGCFGSFDGISGMSRDVASAMSSTMTRTIMSAIGFSGAQDLDCGGIGGLLGKGSVSDCIQKGAYSLISFLISIVATLIILIAIIIALIRLWITLIKAYIYVLLDVITAPIQIMLGILPGGRMGFSRWLKHLTAYLLVFPTAATVIVLAIAFALNKQLNGTNLSPDTSFYPPLIGLPGLSGNLGMLIAFGIIMITPELMDMLKDAFGVKSNSRVSSAITGGFMRGVGPTSTLKQPLNIFGKDKSGAPRIGRIGMTWLTDKAGITSATGVSTGVSNWPGISHFKGTKDWYKRTQAGLMARDFKTVSAQAKNYRENVYRRELARGLSEDEATRNADQARELFIRGKNKIQ